MNESCFPYLFIYLFVSADDILFDITILQIFYWVLFGNQLLVAFWKKNNNKKKKITVRKGDREQQLTQVYYFCLILFLSILIWGYWVELDLDSAPPTGSPSIRTTGTNPRQPTGSRIEGLLWSTVCGPHKTLPKQQKISAAARQCGWIKWRDRMPPLQDGNMQGDNQLIAKCEAAFPPKRDIGKVAIVTRDTEGRVTDYYNVCGQCWFLRVESVDSCSRVQGLAPVIQVTGRLRLVDRLSSGVLSCSGLGRSGVRTKFSIVEAEVMGARPQWDAP